MRRLLLHEVLLVRDAHVLTVTLRAGRRVITGPTHVEQGGREAHGQVTRRHLGGQGGQNYIHVHIGYSPSSGGTTRGSQLYIYNICNLFYYCTSSDFSDLPDMTGDKKYLNFLTITSMIGGGGGGGGYNMGKSRVRHLFFPSLPFKTGSNLLSPPLFEMMTIGQKKIK